MTILRDREVSTTWGCIVAYGLWSCALVLMSIGWLLSDAHMGQFGVVAAIGGATATVRQYFVEQNRLVRNAFELGRDSVATPFRQR